MPTDEATIYISEDRHSGERYAGPMPLLDALSVAEERGGIRMAVSSPHGDYVAVAVRGVVMIRKMNRVSRRAGSVLDTGAWMGIEECSVTSWRPA